MEWEYNTKKKYKEDTMKLFKKVATTVLSLAMAFSFGSCDLLNGIGGKKDPADSSTPSSSEVTGEGAKYMEGIVNSVREANTISATISFAYSYEEEDKTFGKEVYDPYFEETVLDDWNDTCKQSANGEVTLTIAKAGEAYSLQMEGTVSYYDMSYDYDYESGNYEEQVQIVDEATVPLNIRIIGENAYMVNPEDNQWYKTVIELEQDADESMGGVKNTVLSVIGELYATLMDGDLTEVYNLLGPIFEQTLMIDIHNQKYEFSLDVAEYYNAAVQYLTELDYTQTVSAYINSLLVEAGAETTLAEILNSVAAKGTMTIKEVYDQLNAVLKEETGKDINGIKNEIVAKIDLNQFKGSLDDASFAELQQIYQMISDFNIETELAPYMSMTINDVVTMIYGADSESETPAAITLGMFTEQILAMCDNTTLESALTDMTDGEYFAALEQVQNFNLDELEETVTIQFNGYKITGLSYSADVDFEYADDTISQTADVSADVSLTLSKETTTITAPEGAIEMPDDEYEIM